MSGLWNGWQACWLVALGVIGCSSPNVGIDAGSDGALLDAPFDQTPPSMVCHAGTAWNPAQPAFRNSTADWGLGDVRGSKLAVADIDNDGYADLVVMSLG